MPDDRDTDVRPTGEPGPRPSPLRATMSRLGLKPWLKERVLPTIKSELDSIGDLRGAEELKVHAMFARVAASGRPIIVGPWLSEVGFELLYWIPFLRAAFERHGISASRVTVVSRGGVAAWYHDIGERYIECFDLVTPTEFKQGNDQRIASTGSQKHTRGSALDQLILERSGLDVAGSDVIHPSVMYSLFMPFWAGLQPIDLVLRNVRFGPMACAGRGTPATLPLDLPDRYVAVKLYFRDSFEDTAENRTAVRRVLAHLSNGISIVSLDTGLDVDDHSDLVPDNVRVISLGSRLQPSDNLAVQTAAVSGASALLCTYGGFSYLGPLLGVPTFGLISEEPDMVRYHFDVADRMTAALRTVPGYPGSGGLTPLSASVLPVLDHLFTTTP